MDRFGMEGNLDFTSGLSHLQILIQYLETFVELSLTPQLQQDTKQDIEFVKKLVDDAMKLHKVDHILTGSLAEGLSATYSVPNILGIPATFSPEADVMTSIDIRDVLRHRIQYNLEVVDGHPCFVKVHIRGDISEISDLKYFMARETVVFSTNENQWRLLGSSLTQTDDGNYLSPELFMDYHTKLYDHLFMLNSFKDWRTYKFSNHGPAIKITSTRMLTRGKVLISAPPGFEGLNNPFSPQEERNMNQSDLDVVPALGIPEWPPHAQEWITRTRTWPSKAVIDDIASHGVMLVNKPPPGRDPKLHWRLSFSRAEVTLLSDNSFPCRHYAHKIFKYLVKHMVSPPRILNSYHCKTITLWASERMSPESWTWDRLSVIVLGLLDDMIAAVAAKTLKHYFLPQFNLLERIPDDFLHTVGAKLVAIRRRPLDNPPEFNAFTRGMLLSRAEMTQGGVKTEQTEIILKLLDNLRGPFKLRSSDIHAQFLQKLKSCL